MDKGRDVKTIERIGTLLGMCGLLGVLLCLSVRVVMGRFEILFFLSLAGTAICFIFYLATHFNRIVSVIRSRQAIYGTNVFISVVMVLALIAVLNLIVVQGFDKEFDLTEDRLFTLTDQTKSVLHQIDQPLKITAFFSSDEVNPRFIKMRRDAKDLLERYQRESEFLSVEWVDPFIDREMADRYNVEYNGTTVFEMADRRETVTETDEQKFTNAIYRLLKGEIKNIYFLSGHEERSPDDYDQNDGYSDAKEALENQNFVLKDLNLAGMGVVPSDCDVLIIAGPKKPLFDSELKAIEDYVDSGGRLIIMLDPPSDRTPGLVSLARQWGVAVGNDLVIDKNPMGFYLDPRVPLVSEFEFHTVTKQLPPVTFSFACSVTPIDPSPSGISVKSLAKTSPSPDMSWGETSREEARFDPDLDTHPPVSLAVAVESDDGKQPRMIIVGDSDFASNRFFKYSGGGDLLINSVSWLTMEEDLIDIRAQAPKDRTLRPIAEAQARLIQLLSIFMIPLIVFAVGVIVWWMRR